MTNKRITLAERKEIERLIKTGMPASKIGMVIGRGKNVAVCEIRRSGGREKYNAMAAEEMAIKRHLDGREKTITRLKGRNITPYCKISERLDSLEMQLDIIMQIIRGKNDQENK